MKSWPRTTDPVDENPAFSAALVRIPAKYLDSKPCMAADELFDPDAMQCFPEIKHPRARIEI